MKCLDSFIKFVKNAAANRQNNLYDLIFPWHVIWLMLMMPAVNRDYWWVFPAVLIGNYVIDSALLFLGMWIFKVKQQGLSCLHIWKKSSVLIFLFGLIADSIGCLMTDLFQVPAFRLFTNMYRSEDRIRMAFTVFDKINGWWYHSMIMSNLYLLCAKLSANEDHNQMITSICTVGAGLFGAGVACVLIYVFNRYISFRGIKMDDKLKVKLAIFIAVLTTPWYFALPPAS